LFLTKVRASSHKINQAHVEFLKGMNYANGNESIEELKSREKKYHMRQDLQLTVESLMNEGFDEIFEEQDSERKDPYWIDTEISQIIREALDPKLKTRDYSVSNTDSIRKVNFAH
jgi:rRNA maturation endonuclease Nob1